MRRLDFATKQYNAEKVEETYKSTAWVSLDSGSTFIGTDTSAWTGRISSIATTPTFPASPRHPLTWPCVEQSVTNLRFNLTTTMCGIKVNRTGAPWLCTDLG